MESPKPEALPQEASTVEGTVASRMLSFIGVSILAVGFALFASSAWSDLSPAARITLGGLGSAVLIGVGQLVSRRKSSAVNWLGTSVCGAGYSLAFFFAYASYYLEGLRMVNAAPISWLLQVGVAAACTWHGNRNSTLRWFAAPFTLIMSGALFVQAYMSEGTVPVPGVGEVGLQMLGSLGAAVWCAVISLSYRRMEARFKTGTEFEAKAAYWLYRIGHEMYFVLSMANAVALPFFCTGWAHMPLWLALESGLLLAASWRANERFKHAAVGLVALGSLVSLVVLSVKHQALLEVAVAVPLVLIGVGLCYRFFAERLADEELQLTAYKGYTYLGVVLIAALAVLQLGWVTAIPIILAVVPLALLGAILMRDVVLNILSIVAGVVCTVLMVINYGQLTLPILVAYGLVAYSSSLVYRWVARRGGLKGCKFAQPSVTIYGVDALIMEIGFSIAGFVGITVGPLLLLKGVDITIAWAVQALLLSTLGIVTRRVWHRWSAFVTFGAVGVKLFIDLLGAAPMFQILGCLVVGVCFLVGAYLFNRFKAYLEDDVPEPVELVQRPPARGRY